MTVPLVFLISVANARLYKEWKFPITPKALDYLEHPEGWTNSMDTNEILILTGIWLFFSFLFLRKFKSELLWQVPLPGIRQGYAPAWVILIGGLMFLALRGGAGLTPVNESSAYYSERSVDNHLALNPVWGLGSGFSHRTEKGNPYKIMDTEKAESIVESLFIHTDSLEVNVNGKPNLVILLVESLVSDLMDSANSQKYTPFLSSLRDSSIYFRNIYSSGFRTDQGMASVFAGYPSVPDNSIMRYPSKIETLPGLPEAFRNDGYSSTFWYGGNVDFANMRLLLNHVGFSEIVDEDSSPLSNEDRSRWGVPDLPFLRHFAAALDKQSQPFFAGALTLSLHSPFDIPEKGPLSGKDNISGFLNSAWYTDKSIRNFFDIVKKSTWYDKTIFVILADHGNPSAGGREYYDPDSRKIPLMIFGELLKGENREVEVFGNHHDLPAIVLSLFGSDSKDFTWSRNLLKEKDGFAYIAFEPGVGWVTRSSSFSYHAGTDKLTWESGEVDDSLIMTGKAYQQILYQDFLDR